MNEGEGENAGRAEGRRGKAGAPQKPRTSDGARLRSELCSRQSWRGEVYDLRAQRWSEFKEGGKNSQQNPLRVLAQNSTKKIYSFFSASPVPVSTNFLRQTNPRAVESSKLVDLEKTEKSVFFVSEKLRTFFGVHNTRSILIHATGTSQTLNREVSSRRTSPGTYRNHNGGLAFDIREGHLYPKIFVIANFPSNPIFVLSRLCRSSDFKVRLVWKCCQVLIRGRSCFLSMYGSLWVHMEH